MKYYSEHSKFTDPGVLGNHFDCLGRDIKTLCHLTHELILHYADQELYQYKIPENRFHEMDTRYVTDMLQLLFSYDSRPLNNARDAQNRMIGVCRDNSILICSILRHKNIPARLRVGFCEYIIPGLYLDGICLEYWNDKLNKWCLVDTRTPQVYLDKCNITLDFDLHDLPRGGKFILASDAWKLCRTNQINPNRFGSRMHRGLWYVKNRLLQDLAFLTKQEVLIWDLWGIMLANDEVDPKKIPESQLSLLDELADFIDEHSFNPDKIFDFYHAHRELQVPNELLVDNPFVGLKQISLRD